jgi:hypothetical protein
VRSKPLSDTDVNDEIYKAILETLSARHGRVLSPQKHDLPEWLGKGWLVSFELPGIQPEGTPAIRAALFHDENGRPMLAREIVVRDTDGNYPKWKPLSFWKSFEPPLP